MITPEQQALNSACEELQAKIKSTWKYDSIEQHYMGNDSFLTELSFNENKYRDCMESKDTSYIVGLFGQHYRIETNPQTDKTIHKLIYMTTKYPCLGKAKDYHCGSLIFDFKDGGAIEKVIYNDISGSYVE